MFLCVECGLTWRLHVDRPMFCGSLWRCGAVRGRWQAGHESTQFAQRPLPAWFCHSHQDHRTFDVLCKGQHQFNASAATGHRLDIRLCSDRAATEHIHLKGGSGATVRPTHKQRAAEAQCSRLQPTALPTTDIPATRTAARCAGRRRKARRAGERGALGRLAIRAKSERENCEGRFPIRATPTGTRNQHPAERWLGEAYSFARYFALPEQRSDFGGYFRRAHRTEVARATREGVRRLSPVSGRWGFKGGFRGEIRFCRGNPPFRVRAASEVSGRRSVNTFRCDVRLGSDGVVAWTGCNEERELWRLHGRWIGAATGAGFIVR